MTEFHSVPQYSSRCFRWCTLAFAGVIVGGLALPAPNSRAQEDLEPPPADETVQLRPIALLVVRPAGQEDFLGVDGGGELIVDLFAGEELAAVVDDERAAPTMSFDSVREALSAASREGLIIEVVYFSGEDALEQTGRADLGLLGRLAERGLAVGVHGDGLLLREKLGLAAPDTEPAPPPPSGDEAHEVAFVRVGAAIGRVEAFSHATVNGETFGEVVNALVDWMTGRDGFVDLAAEASPSPWDAIYHHQWTGNMVGIDGPEKGVNIGTYQFTIAIYLLSTEDPEVDWWRVDLASNSNIANYVKSTKRCGFWTYSMTSFVDLLGRARYWSYMPDTTVANHSETFTIGGNISVRPGISAAYSQSYGTSDVTIRVNADSVDEYIKWTTNLSGCHDYFWYPWYKGASNAAKGSYTVAPSVIVEVPKEEEHFEFKTWWERPEEVPEGIVRIHTRRDLFVHDPFGGLNWDISNGFVDLAKIFVCSPATCNVR
jgi:hypothetical protein